MTAKHLPVSILALLAGAVLAEPFSLDKTPTHIPVPLPAHAASQMQAAAEQRAEDVEAGAATTWGTAQADWLIGQLRAAGVLPPDAVPDSVRESLSKVQPSAPAAGATSEAGVFASDGSAELPHLLPGLDEDTLRLMVARFYAGLPERVLHENTLAFRKDASRVMRDVLMALGGAYGIYLSKPVDWDALKATSEVLVNGHSIKLIGIFVDALKASARSSQEAGATAKE